MKKSTLLSAALLLFTCTLSAQTGEEARERAIRIADRIVATTTYDFINKQTGDVYTSLKGVKPDKNVKVKSKYLDWHYTNGVTNLALMELGDKLGTKKYEEFVLKNLTFIFRPDNQAYFKGLYEKTLKEEGWLPVRNVKLAHDIPQQTVGRQRTYGSKPGGDEPTSPQQSF